MFTHIGMYLYLYTYIRMQPLLFSHTCRPTDCEPTLPFMDWRFNMPGLLITGGSPAWPSDSRPNTHSAMSGPVSLAEKEAPHLQAHKH